MTYFLQFFQTIAGVLIRMILIVTVIIVRMMLIVTVIRMMFNVIDYFEVFPDNTVCHP